MVKVLEGKLECGGKRVTIVASRFNDFVTRRLVDGAVDCLLRHGAEDDAIDIYWVPGSFEIAQMASRRASAGKSDGLLCLGTVVRGETPHFDLLCSSVARSIGRLSETAAVPVALALVTADSMDQAIDRAGAKHGNKGWQGALALIEMMKLWEIE